MFLCSCWGVQGGCQGIGQGIAMGLLRLEWFKHIALQFLGYFGWLPRRCYAIAKVLSGFKHVALQLLGCSGLFPGHCCVVAKV